MIQNIQMDRILIESGHTQPHQRSNRDTQSCTGDQIMFVSETYIPYQRPNQSININKIICIGYASVPYPIFIRQGLRSIQVT
jgi:hypothetical protein